MTEQQLPKATPAADCGASKTPESPCAAKQSDTARAPSDRAGRFASFGALLSAFIASSGCWLPPLLLLGGISGAGMTAFMAEYRTIFMVATFAILACAFYLTYRPRAVANGGRSKIMSLNKAMLWAVTAIAVVFLFFPQTVTGLFASNDEFTADMEQTVVTIEGMTGHTGTAKAEEAIKTAPGVLAVKVDFATRQATIGTKKGEKVPKAKILATLESLNYRGEFVNN